MSTLTHSNAGPNPVKPAPRTPPRPAATATDPSPALVGLFHLPLAHPGLFDGAQELLEEFAELEESARQIGRSPDRASWHDIYVRAIEVADHLEAHLAVLHRQLAEDELEAPDAQSLRNELVERPRRAAEQFRARVRQILQERRSSWTDRLRRQQDHVLRPGLESLGAVAVRHTQARGEMVSRFEPSDLERHRVWLDATTQRWQREVEQGFLSDLEIDIERALGSVRRAYPDELPPFPLRDASGFAQLPGARQERDLVRENPVDGFWGALGKFVMTNFFRTGMLLSMVVFPVFLGGADGFGSMRSLAYMAAIPIALVLGLFWVAGDRKKKRASLEKDTASQLQQQASEDLTGRLRDTQERLVSALSRTQEGAIGLTRGWVEQVLEPRASELAEHYKSRIVDVQLRQRALKERISLVAGLKTKVQQNVRSELVKCARRHDPSPH